MKILSRLAASAAIATAFAAAGVPAHAADDQALLLGPKGSIAGMKNSLTTVAAHNEAVQTQPQTSIQTPTPTSTPAPAQSQKAAPQQQAAVDPLKQCADSTKDGDAVKRAVAAAVRANPALAVQDLETMKFRAAYNICALKTADGEKTSGADQSPEQPPAQPPQQPQGQSRNFNQNSYPDEDQSQIYVVPNPLMMLPPPVYYRRPVYVPNYYRQQQNQYNYNYRGSSQTRSHNHTQTQTKVIIIRRPPQQQQHQQHRQHQQQQRQYHHHYR
jgi:hypothetical protein